jgi:hypothetical protein
MVESSRSRVENCGLFLSSSYSEIELCPTPDALASWVCVRYRAVRRIAITQPISSSPAGSSPVVISSLLEARRGRRAGAERCLPPMCDPSQDSGKA